jgi:hypothetical protein
MAFRTTVSPCLVAVALGLAAPLVDVAAQPVYRCDDGKGGVLYADTPCKGGATVDLAPGKADPAAIERLRREQRAFDERQAARELRAQQEAQAQREYRLAQREWQLDAGAALLAERLAAERNYYWGGYWPWVPTPPVAKPPPGPPRPPWPDALPQPPYVPAAPGRFGLPSPPPGKPASPLPAPRPPVSPPAPPSKG